MFSDVKVFHLLSKICLCVSVDNPLHVEIQQAIETTL